MKYSQFAIIYYWCYFVLISFESTAVIIAYVTNYDNLVSLKINFLNMDPKCSSESSGTWICGYTVTAVPYFVISIIAICTIIINVIVNNIICGRQSNEIESDTCTIPNSKPNNLLSEQKYQDHRGYHGDELYECTIDFTFEIINCVIWAARLGTNYWYIGASQSSIIYIFVILDQIIMTHFVVTSIIIPCLNDDTLIKYNVKSTAGLCLKVLITCIFLMTSIWFVCEMAINPINNWIDNTALAYTVLWCCVTIWLIYSFISPDRSNRLPNMQIAYVFTKLMLDGFLVISILSYLPLVVVLNVPYFSNYFENFSQGKRAMLILQTIIIYLLIIAALVISTIYRYKSYCIKSKTEINNNMSDMNIKIIVSPHGSSEQQ